MAWRLSTTNKLIETNADLPTLLLKPIEKYLCGIYQNILYQLLVYAVTL